MLDYCINLVSKSARELEPLEPSGQTIRNWVVQFDNGVRAYLRSTEGGLATWEVDVIGTGGRVRSGANALDWEMWRPMPGGPRNRGLAARVPFPWPARMQGMGLTIVDDLIHCVESGDDPRCSGDDGRAALEVAVALRESHRRGCVKVELPLADRGLGILSSEIREDDVPARVRRERAAAQSR